MFYMKRLMFLLLALLGVANGLKAQEAKPFTMDTVIYAEGRDAMALYDAAKLWLSTNVDLGSDNLTFNYDEERRFVSGKALIKFQVNHLTWSGMSGVITCTYNIATRDGRARFVVTDVVHDSSGHDGWDEGLIYEEIPVERNKGIMGKQHREVYKRVKKQVTEWFNTQSASLASYLNMYQSIQDEDW